MYVHDILGVSQGQLLEYLTSLWIQINLAQCICIRGILKVLIRQLDIHTYYFLTYYPAFVFDWTEMHCIRVSEYTGCDRADTGIYIQA